MLTNVEVQVGRYQSDTGKYAGVTRFSSQLHNLIGKTGLYSWSKYKNKVKANVSSKWKWKEEKGHEYTVGHPPKSRATTRN